MRIDAHHHLWPYRAADYPWISPQMPALRRDFLAADFSTLLAEEQMTGSVVVQARMDNRETDWLVSQAQELPGVHGVVGWMDPSRGQGEVEETLQHWDTQPRIRGARHLVQDEASPGEWLKQESLITGMGALQRRGYVWDLLITHRHLEEGKRFAARHDQHWIVLDHCAKPWLEKGASEWMRQVAPLAALPHVVCKISGLVTEAQDGRWSDEQLQPFIDGALALFGPQRLLFGSDWPVCLLASSHQRLHQFYRTALTALSVHEQRAIWGENAWRIYGLAECEYGS